MVWLTRDRLLPTPSQPEGPAPPFRTPKTPPDSTSPAATAVAHNLQAITGIGPVYAGRLADEGISSLADLIAAETSAIAEAAEVKPATVLNWKTQAAKIVR